MASPRSPARAEPYPAEAREAIYRVIADRRDVRQGFLPDSLPQPLLDRLLQAAHQAPSVGLMQPTRFVVVRSPQTRQSIHAAFVEANRQAAESYNGERRTLYDSLRLEAILQTPLNLCVLCDSSAAQGHGLGRQTMPETAAYSTVCALQNLWLAARAEGVGIGWVSIVSPEALRSILQIPPHVTPVAYLCMGFVQSFADVPELERAGWETRRSLASVVSYEQYQPDQVVDTDLTSRKK